MRRAGLSFAATGNKQLTKFIARLQSLATSCNGWYGSDGYCLMPRPLSSPVLSFQLTTLLKLVDRVRKHGEGGGQSGTQNMGREAAKAAPPSPILYYPKHGQQ